MLLRLWTAQQLALDWHCLADEGSEVRGHAVQLLRHPLVVIYPFSLAQTALAERGGG